MFRANHSHKQQTLSDSTQWMNAKIREKLEKSWTPIFYEHVFCKIDEEPFAVLYGTTGKPNFPVNILLSLEYIKHMKCCSDLELLDDFYFDYLVNYAVGIRTLGEMNLAERTLYYFRERIYQYCLENPGKEDLLFGQFIKLLHDFAAKAGISLEEQRTDNTLFMSNIKKAGRMSLAYDILNKAVKAIPKEKLTDSLAKALEPDFKTDVLYRAKAQEGDSKLTLLLNLCREALLILEVQPGMQESEEVRILKRFLAEQSTTEDGSEKLIPKPKKEIPSGSLQSAYDEDATLRRKGNMSQSGYVLEISETCHKENTFQLITDYTVVPNNVSDVEILQGRLKGIRENTGCSDMYVDGGFHSEDVHQTAAENGIEIHLTNMSGTEPTKKIFP
ncbi:MAG: transposase [Peptococcaceae bacterium]|nr:transposase [Peptococcaceae bacterium]